MVNIYVRSTGDEEYNMYFEKDTNPGKYFMDCFDVYEGPSLNFYTRLLEHIGVPYNVIIADELTPTINDIVNWKDFC